MFELLRHFCRWANSFDLLSSAYSGLCGNLLRILPCTSGSSPMVFQLYSVRERPYSLQSFPSCGSTKHFLIQKFPSLPNFSFGPRPYRDQAFPDIHLACWPILVVHSSIRGTSRRNESHGEVWGLLGNLYQPSRFSLNPLSLVFPTPRPLRFASVSPGFFRHELDGRAFSFSFFFFFGFFFFFVISWVSVALPFSLSPA